MKGVITIKDIAKELNVHHSTVSRALTGDPRVKLETQQKIRNYAKENGYVQNYSAISLRDGMRNMIAVIVPNVHHRFFSNIISLIANLATEKGYITVVYQSNENIEEEKEIVNNILKNRFAGVIASISMESVNVDHFKKLSDYNIPLVLFDRISDDLNVSKVVAKSYDAVKEATTLLLDKGYKRVVYLGGSQEIKLFKERRSGYVEALPSADNALFIEITEQFTVETGREYLKKLLSNSVAPDAVICDSYNIALGVFGEAKTQGLSIPNDLAIISFGNDKSAEMLTPSMCQIKQPEEQFANNAFELLLQHIQEPLVEPKEVYITLELCIRGSC